MTSGLFTILLVIHSILVLFLIGIILIQRTDADGMGGLGGGGGNQFLTGRAQANLLTRTTAILATLFIVSSLALAFISSRSGTHSIVDAVEETAPAESGGEGAPAPAPTVPKAD